MPKLNQVGAAALLPILILLIGLVVGVYLVGQKTNLLPKAYEAPSIFEQTSEKLTPNCTHIESVAFEGNDGRIYGPYNNNIVPEVIRVPKGQNVFITAKIANDDNNRRSVDWSSSGGKFEAYQWDRLRWIAPDQTGVYDVSMKIYGVDQPYCSLKFSVGAWILGERTCSNIRSVTRADGSFTGPITTEYPHTVKVTPGEKVTLEARVKDDNGIIIKFLDNSALANIDWNATGGTFSEQDWNKVSWTAPAEEGNYQASLMIDNKDQSSCVVPFQVTSQ